MLRRRLGEWDCAECGYGAWMLTALWARRTPLPFLPRLTRAVLYGAQVFLSFFLMLVFMTYNVSLADFVLLTLD